jgi:hypothetical protein
MFTGLDWAQRFVWTRGGGFTLLEEAEPDRINQPYDARYVALGVFTTRLPFKRTPTLDDTGRNVYLRDEKLHWNDVGTLIGRFGGFVRFQGQTETVIDSRPLCQVRH